LHVDSVNVQNLDAFEKPLVLDVKYVVPDAFHTVSSATKGLSLVGHIPSPCEKTYLQAGYTQKRNSPFEFRVPVRLQSTVEFQLPKGFELKDVDRLNHSDRTAFVAWSSRCKLESEAVKLEFSASRPAGRYPAAKYSAYYEDTKKAIGLFDRPLVIQSLGDAKGAN
jgi:hypothetical protein